MPAPSPKVYVASPLGFTEAGRIWNDSVLIPALLAAGVEPLDPWASSDAVMQLLAALELPNGADRTAELEAANDAVARANVDRIDASVGLIAVLDGSDVDSGTASEIAYACAKGKSVVGVRTDLRLTGDNEAAPINLQVLFFIHETGGHVHRDLGEAISELVVLVGV